MFLNFYFIHVLKFIYIEEYIISEELYNLKK